MKITFPMKSTVYNRLAVAIAAAVMVACSAASPDDKQAQLDKLKAQQADIAKQVATLEADIQKTSPDSATSVKMKEVVVTELSPRSFSHYVQTQGSVDAEDNILVSAQSPGVVKAVYVKEGQQVSKGQVLAQTDNSVILSSIEAQKAQLELANSVFQRQKNLWDQKIGTEVQYLQAKTNKESLEKQIQSLQDQNDMTRIKSPINGTVDQVVVKIGENIMPGMPAARVVNTSNLKMVANVSEAYVTDIQKGNKVLISIPELKKEIASQVTFVGKTIDPLSRTFPVEVKLSSDKNLRPNMTGVLKIIFRTEPSVMVVPVNVVQELNKEKIVFVAGMDGKQAVARKKVVTLEGVYDNQAQVSGLEPGDKIISVGYQGLSDGQAIKF